MLDSLGRVVALDSVGTARLSIGALFARLREDIRRGAPYVQITYDPQFGYPAYSLTDYPEWTDSYMVITIRRFMVTK